MHLLTPAETAHLLEPWLGPSVPFADLPMPRLVDLRTDPAKTIDLATLRKHLASVVPGARLDEHRAWLQGLHAAALRLDLILAAGLAVALALVATSAAATTRSALIAHHSLIDLVLLLGAADSAIASPFAVRALRLGLLGGVIGSAVLALTIAALGNVAGIVEPAVPIAGTGVADWRLWAILIGLVVAAGLIATASSWLTVWRLLARMS